jgi:hypothetical protein
MSPQGHYQCCWLICTQITQVQVNKKHGRERMFWYFDNDGDPGLAGVVGQEIAQEYHKVKNKSGVHVYRKTYKLTSSFSALVLEDGLCYYQTLEKAVTMAEAVYAFHAQPAPSKTCGRVTSAYFIDVFFKVKKEIFERPDLNSPGRVTFGGSNRMILSKEKQTF